MISTIIKEIRLDDARKAMIGMGTIACCHYKIGMTRADLLADGYGA